jgi:hypothetical protein
VFAAPDVKKLCSVDMLELLLACTSISLWVVLALENAALFVFLSVSGYSRYWL